MRIAYATFGSRGDTQPHIAFAVEVRRLPRVRVSVRSLIPLCACTLHLHLHSLPPTGTLPSVYVPSIRTLHSHPPIRTLHSHPLHSHAPLAAPSTRTLPSHPPLADCVQLVRAGHEVRLYISPDYLLLVLTVAGLHVIGTQRSTAAIRWKRWPHIIIEMFIL